MPVQFGLPPAITTLVEKSIYPRIALDFFDWLMSWKYLETPFNLLKNDGGHRVSCGKRGAAIIGLITANQMIWILPVSALKRSL